MRNRDNISDVRIDHPSKYWLVPGVIIQWLVYMSPGRGIRGVAASTRAARSPLMTYVFSVAFYFWMLVFLLAFVTGAKSQTTRESLEIPQGLCNTPLVLYTSPTANVYSTTFCEYAIRLSSLAIKNRLSRPLPMVTWKFENSSEEFVGIPLHVISDGEVGIYLFQNRNGILYFSGAVRFAKLIGNKIIGGKFYPPSNDLESMLIQGQIQATISGAP